MGFGMLDSDGSDATGSEVLVEATGELGTCEGTETVVFADETGTGVLLAGNSVRLRLAVALAGAVDEFSMVSADNVEAVGVRTSDVVAVVESSGIGATGSVVDDSAPAVAAVSDTDELFTATAVELVGVTGTSSGEIVELAAVSLVVVVLVVGMFSVGVVTIAVGIARDVDEISSGNTVELAASVLTANVGNSEDVGAGTEVSSTDENGASDDRAGRVVLIALEGGMTTSGVLSAAFSVVLSVVLSILGVLEGLSRRSIVSVVDVVVGVGVGDGSVVGWLDEVVEVGTTMDVGMLDDEVDEEVVDGSVSLSSDSKVSIKDTGTGGVLKVLVAVRVPFVTIWRLTCLRRYFGLSAPPCPAGAAAVAGLSVASTARDAAKTIDDLRTIAVTECSDIIYIIRCW